MSLLRFMCYKLKKCFLFLVVITRIFYSEDSWLFLEIGFISLLRRWKQASRTWVLDWCLVSMKKRKSLLNKWRRDLMFLQREIQGGRESIKRVDSHGRECLRALELRADPRRAKRNAWVFCCVVFYHVGIGSPQVWQAVCVCDSLDQGSVRGA